MKRLAHTHEADFIRRLASRLSGDGDRRLLVGIGDDTAVWKCPGRDLVLTSDAVIEGAHFLPGVEPARIGHKAVGRVLSDCAAMGAVPEALLINLIAELAALDDRCTGVKVDEYLPPAQNAHGRYPDVLVEWKGFGPFAVEYQMSHTFQTEVSQRCIHYDREGIPLLWVLSSFDPDRVPQAVSDVVHRHRGNAFVLDQAAVMASREQQTLVLSCFMSNGQTYEGPVLVRFDALTFPESKRPYFEDRLAKPLLEKIAERRLPYFHALRAWGDRLTDLPLADLAPFQERHRVDRLVAAAFSIVAEAAGKPENFASEHDNIKGMMNTYQNSGSLAPYSRLLTVLIGNTAQRSLLDGTVGKHLRQSITGHRLGQVAQVSEDSQEWQLLRELLPEALDPFIRQRLKDVGALPAWAV